MKKLFAEGGKIVARQMSADRIDQLMPARDTITPKDRLAAALQTAWQSYVGLFGEQPHGTLPQMKALVAFIPESFIGEPAKPPITVAGFCNCAGEECHGDAEAKANGCRCRREYAQGWDR